MRRFLSLKTAAAAALLSLTSLAPALPQALDLRCEMQTNPLGIDTKAPRLSWRMEAPGRAQHQSAYAILAATTTSLLAPGKADLWESGRRAGRQSIQIPYEGKPLASNQQVFWTVRIWDAEGAASPWAPPAQWTMALLSPRDWKARWITLDTSPYQTTAPHSHILPVFRKTLSLRAPVRRALVHVCGLGQHKLFVNGRPASSTFLDPPWSMYAKTAFYNTLDITALLRPGENALGVMLGKGFYNTSGDRRIHGVQAERPLVLLLQAHVEYADGSHELVASDASWKATRAPMTHNAILGGTDYDARLLADDWAEPRHDDSHWHAAALADAPPGELIAAFSPPLRTFEELRPVSIEEPEPGHFVYDFGQNASAAPRLKVKGPAGATLRLSYAEQRHGAREAHNDGKGRIDPAGIGSPAYFDYTLRGDKDGETWFSDFFYSGYQYIELTGAVPEGFPNPTGLPVVSELVSMHVHADTPAAGSFACSDPIFGRIERMVDWSVRSNLSHVLTDCPHREKLGWLEVSYLMWSSMAFRYDLSNYAAKIARDIRDSQGADGVIYTVAPNYPDFKDGFRYTPEWGAAGVFVPWYCYRWYGDKRTLEASFEPMKRFVDYMRTSAGEGLCPKAGLGDWYDYGHGGALGPSRFTPTELSAMAIFHECAEVVSLAAGVLGRPEEEKSYAELARRIATEFNERFYDSKSAEYKNSGSPQTANAMALVTGIAEPGERARIAECIVGDLRKRANLQTSGDIGFRFLLRALADSGHNSAVLDILARSELGSYAFLVNAGWTSLPESWNAQRSYSMNHCMLGHIQEWFVHDLAGIQPDDKAVAFERFQIKPLLESRLTSASASYRSLYGEIACAWEKKGEAWEVRVRIPPNTTAHVHLPAARAGQVREGQTSAAKAQGVRYLRQEDGRAVFEVGSGEYRFRAPREYAFALSRPLPVHPAGE